MALAHQFAVFRKKEEDIRLQELQSVFVSDAFMQYIKDSLSWVQTEWNGQKSVSGFPEEGFTIVEREQIRKLKEIAEQWKELFKLSPNEFYVTDSNEHEKAGNSQVCIKREEFIEECRCCIKVCSWAIEKEAELLYQGI